jgi:DNA-binding transcriptional ArsR family regulator
MYQKETYTRNSDKILLALIERRMDFTTLLDRVKLSAPALSKHLKDLLERKIISFEAKGKRRIYYPLEAAYQQPGVKNHIVGIVEAYRTIKGRKKFWSEVGRKAVSLFSQNPDAAFSFLSAISRYRIHLETHPQNGIEWLFMRMVEDYNLLKEMREIVRDLELNGLKPRELKRKFQSRAEDLRNLYIALGPPFSYRWLEMVEKLEE